MQVLKSPVARGYADVYNHLLLARRTNPNRSLLSSTRLLMLDSMTEAFDADTRSARSTINDMVAESSVKEDLIRIYLTRQGRLTQSGTRKAR